MPLFQILSPPCIFVHIPKTGGHSIRNEYFKGHYVGPWFGDKLPHEWQQLFKFAFVRNPFDRIISAWKMFTVGVQDNAWKVPGRKQLDLTLKETLLLGLNQGVPPTHPRYNGKRPNTLTRLKNHIIPQSHPYHGIQHVDFIGRFESLQKDFQLIANTLDLPTTQLKKTNWTKRKPYQAYFDKETKDLALKLYHRDLDLYQYQF